MSRFTFKVICSSGMGGPAMNARAPGMKLYDIPIVIWYIVIASLAIQGLRAEGKSQRLLEASLIADEVVADLESVTPDDLVRVAHDLIQDDRLRLAVVGPFDDTGPFEQALRL